MDLKKLSRKTDKIDEVLIKTEGTKKIIGKSTFKIKYPFLKKDILKKMKRIATESKSYKEFSKTIKDLVLSGGELAKGISLMTATQLRDFWQEANKKTD